MWCKIFKLGGVSFLLHMRKLPLSLKIIFILLCDIFSFKNFKFGGVSKFFILIGYDISSGPVIG